MKTRALVQAVKRNLERFPEDFVFQLSKEELDSWRSQIVMSNPAAKMALRRCAGILGAKGLGHPPVTMLPWKDMSPRMATRHARMRTPRQADAASSDGSGQEDGHQGGQRYEASDPGFQVIRNWVVQQAKLQQGLGGAETSEGR